jgi:site-specific recombinase XerD
MLMEIVKQHNDDIKLLIGKDVVKATWTKYNCTQKHLASFLYWKHKKKDVDITTLSYEFIADFEFYLKTQKNIQVNTNGKYLKNFRKIIKECVLKNWLQKDPFIAFKIKEKKSKRTFLTEEELAKVEGKVFSIERLDHIKDLFLFSCYTGLSYVDIYNLTTENICLGIDGQKWIFTHRQKTEVPSHIPLLPQPLRVLEKYKNHPASNHAGKLIPVPSNQKVNAYLKEIADCCGIKKLLTFHMARHTFATTVTLNNGVPIESVSKMLGHTKIQTTQIYAKILDKKVSFDMQQLRKVFENNELTKTKAVGQ